MGWRFIRSDWEAKELVVVKFEERIGVAGGAAGRGTSRVRADA
jgi:hypothetical protein